MIIYGTLVLPKHIQVMEIFKEVFTQMHVLCSAHVNILHMKKYVLEIYKHRNKILVISDVIFPRYIGNINFWT